MGQMCIRDRSDIALAAGAEAGAGGGDHVGLVEQLVEELPGTHAVGGLGPDIGRVLAAGHGEASGLQAVEDDLGVALVEGNVLHDLSMALGGINRCV